MKCPIDGTKLVMTERHGVEIDYCPVCRGVWLDRGELDKIIEKSVPPMMMAEPEPKAPVQEAPPVREWREPYREPPDEKPRKKDLRYAKRYSKKKRYKSILDEIFDFD